MPTENNCADALTARTRGLIREAIAALDDGLNVSLCADLRAILAASLSSSPQLAQADARAGLTDEQRDALKLAIDFIASSARQDRGGHVARIRALLDDDRA